jgi:putative transposase
MALWIHNYSVYGRRKLWKAARRADIDAGRDQVARLMRAQGLRGATRAKKRFTTKADSTHTRAPDLVRRNFTATRPDELWVADFTYSAQLSVMCSRSAATEPLAWMRAIDISLRATRSCT